MNLKLTSISLLASLAMQASALPVYAASHEAIPPTPPAVPTSTQGTDVVCMQKAVEQRDNTLITVVDSYHMAVKKALEVRRESAKNAWAKTDRQERRTALRMVAKDYKIAVGKARMEFKKAKQAAWSQFGRDRKACGPQVAQQDPMTSGVDAQL